MQKGKKGVLQRKYKSHKVVKGIKDRVDEELGCEVEWKMEKKHEIFLVEVQ